MKKYLVTFYVVEKNIWKCHFSYTFDSSELPITLMGIRSRGFIKKEDKNIYIKTFSSDVDTMHMIYTIVEIPINL